MSSSHIFSYPARAIHVVDGDTIDVILDLGLRLTSTQRLRLLGVNTPELHSKDLETRTAALAAKQFTTDMLASWQPHDADPWPLLVATSKADAFGRWLADVTAPALHTLSLSQIILEAKQGVVFL